MKRPSHPGTGLSERHRQFVEAFMANGGNATRAAITAGYSKRTADRQASRLLRNAKVRGAIDARAKSDPAVWTREDRQRFWTSVASGTGRFATAPLRDRLKASELLGKSQADFVERHEIEAGSSLVDLLAAVERSTTR